MKNIITIRNLILVSVFTLALGSCKDDFTSPTGLSGKPLGETMAANSNFTLFTEVVKKTGQFQALNNNNSGLVTAFVPSDPAFIAYFSAAYPAYFGTLPPPVTEVNVMYFLSQLTFTTAPTFPTLATFTSTTIPIINYHLVSSKLTSGLITGNQVFATLNGARLSISKTPTATLLNANSSTNGASIASFDVLASNGVAHSIDRVMAAVATATVLTSMAVTVSYATNPATIGSPATDGTTTDFDLLANLIRYTGQAPIILPNTTPLPDFTIFQANDGIMTTALNSMFASAMTEIQWGAYLVALTPATTTTPTLDQLTTLVKYQVVPGRFLTPDFTNEQVLKSLLTSPTIIVGVNPVPPAIGPYTYTLTDANTGVANPVITSANILTNSGILHTVNGVLRPF